METKAGIKTTEFWLNLLAILVGVFVNSGILPEQHLAVKIGGMVLAALGAMGYTWSRTRSKQGAGEVKIMLLPLLLALSLGGCGVSLTKLIADARMVATVGADVAGGVSAVVGLTCSVVAKYGDEQDVKNCEVAVTAAKAAAAASKAAAAVGQPAPAVAAKAQVVKVAQPVDVVVSPAQVEKVRAATLKACPVAIPGN